MSKYVRWTAEEDSILEAKWLYGFKAVRELLPHRSHNSLNMMGAGTSPQDSRVLLKKQG